VANLITSAGANRVLRVDLHAGQIQGFFGIPTDNLYVALVMSADIMQRFGCENIMVVSPDVGGALMCVQNSALQELVVSDSIQLPDVAAGIKQLRPLSIAPLLGEAVRRIADETSVSSLFD
jgi:phosphoribosylpyrophosphate synthetase